MRGISAPSEKREIGSRRRDGFTRVDSEYYTSVLLVVDKVVLIQVSISWSRQIIEHERAVAAKEAAGKGTQ